MFDEFNALFRLDLATGKLYNRTTRPGGAFKDWEAGCFDAAGYRVVKYKGKVYGVHNIVWLLTRGEWPPHFHLGNKARIVVDHANRIRSDNRPDNLRLLFRGNNKSNTHLQPLYIA